MSNSSFHPSYIETSVNDTDYDYYQHLHQYIQYQHSPQNQNIIPFQLPNESYYSTSGRNQNETSSHYYQYLKQCLQHQHVPQNQGTVPFQIQYNSFRSSLPSFYQNQIARALPVSIALTQNQILPTIDHQRVRSIPRSSYENNRAVSTVMTEKSLYNESSSQGTRNFIFTATSSDEDNVQLLSITAMKEYRDKSFEELRLEDYELANKEKTVSSHNDKKEINDDSLCVVCLEEKKTIVYLPCFHMCTCANCGMKELLTKCPICRKPIDCKQKVFW